MTPTTDPTSSTSSSDSSATPTPADAPIAQQSTTAPAPAAAGDLVRYRFRDIVTGGDIAGVGFVTHAADGGCTVAPFSNQALQLSYDAVTVIDPADAES